MLFRSDIQDVLGLANIQTPKSITLFVPEQWKFEFFQQFKDLFANTKNPGDIIKALMQTELRKHGDTIVKLIPKFCKEPGIIPDFLLGQKKEATLLEEAAQNLQKRFNCTVKVVKEQDSTEQKAKNSWPGKPAILVN